MSEDGRMGKEVNSRNQAGWNNWKRYSSVLCDRKMDPKLRAKFTRQPCDQH